MTYDKTEHIRRILVGLINAGYSEDEAQRRAELVVEYGEDNVWNTDEATTVFKFKQFLAPFAYVQRRKDGVTGTVEFTHSPRFYFNFQEE